MNDPNVRDAQGEVVSQRTKIDCLTAELGRVSKERDELSFSLRMIADHVRPLIPYGQDPAQADNPYGIIGYMVLERKRAEKAEEEYARLLALHEGLHGRSAEAV